jgi:glycosyltransferase involved in cell wall biosynthesis
MNVDPRTDDLAVMPATTSMQMVIGTFTADISARANADGLSSMHFVANANSVHVMRWLQILSRIDCSVTIETANRVSPSSDGFAEIRPLLPKWLRIPMTLRYVLAGLVMRYRTRNGPRSLIHAHSASGNGLIAWLSGQRYVVGTYGSEILSAGKRGFAYRWLLRQILHGAERISACSMETIRVLAEELGVPRERIYYFHLGYDEDVFHAVDGEQRRRLRRAEGISTDEPVWVINRRTRPLYRTAEVVDGFLRYCEQGGCGQLVVLCGDHQPDYTRQISERIREHAATNRIRIVEHMLPQREIARWLQLADFSISVPQSDNFSISTLEGMGCGAVPVLADLVAYEQLRPCRAVQWMTQFTPADFAAMFVRTAQSWPTLHAGNRLACQQYALEGFSTLGASRDVAAFYNGTPLTSQGMASELV